MFRPEPFPTNIARGKPDKGCCNFFHFIGDAENNHLFYMRYHLLLSSWDWVIAFYQIFSKYSQQCQESRQKTFFFGGCLPLLTTFWKFEWWNDFDKIYKCNTQVNEISAERGRRRRRVSGRRSLGEAAGVFLKIMERDGRGHFHIARAVIFVSFLAK